MQVFGNITFLPILIKIDLPNEVLGGIYQQEVFFRNFTFI